MFEARCSSEGNTGVSPNGIVATPPIWNIDVLWPPRGLLSGGGGNLGPMDNSQGDTVVETVV